MDALELRRIFCSVPNIFLFGLFLPIMGKAASHTKGLVAADVKASEPAGFHQ